MQDELVVGRTRRVNASLQYSRTVAEKVAAHRVLIESAEAILLSHCDTVQLAATPASEVAPGEQPQLLHRDDWNWGHVQHRSHPLSVFTIVALSEFRADFGATRVIPGSHRWVDAYEASTDRQLWRQGIYEEKSLPKGKYDELAVPALLQPGSAIIALGTTLHGAGENVSGDVYLRALQMKYCMGWLRTTQNNYLLYPPDVAKTFPEPVQRLLGYQLEAKHLGMLEQGVDPISLLRD